MNTKSVKTVKMFGPSISDPSKIVNRDVPEVDVAAYELAGYTKGSKDEADVVAAVESEVAEVEEVEPSRITKAKPRGKK
jgi:hypothetical protein